VELELAAPKREPVSQRGRRPAKKNKVIVSASDSHECLKGKRSAVRPSAGATTSQIHENWLFFALG